MHSLDVASSSGTLVISLDFELFWGFRDRVGLGACQDLLQGARRAIPLILQRFQSHEIRATWAIVGLLMCDGRREARRFMPRLRPGYRDRRLEASGEFSALGASEREDPSHFAPSLVEQIASTPRQEIGSHTFSHYYCLAPQENPQALGADLEAARAVMAHRLGDAPKALVFPRNQFDRRSLETADALGFEAIRGNRSHWAYQVPRGAPQNGVRRGVRWADAHVQLCSSAVLDQPRSVPQTQLVNVPASAFLRPAGWPGLDHARLERLKLQVTEAAREGRVFHVWWHPHNFGRSLARNMRALDRFLVHVDVLRQRYGLRSRSVLETARCLS